MASPMIALKGPLMNKKDYSSNFPLKHAQKDMRFALGLGDKVRCRSKRDAYMRVGSSRCIYGGRLWGSSELLPCKAERGVLSLFSLNRRFSSTLGGVCCPRHARRV